MLDIGWTELLVIAVVLIVVVGPKDLPPMIRAFGKMTKRLRQTAGEFRSQFDEALREAELDDLKKSVDDIRSLNPANSLREAINPLRQMGQDIKSDLQKASRVDAPATSSSPVVASSPVVSAPVAENSILPDLVAPTAPPSDLVSAAPAAPAVAAAAPATSSPAGIDQPVTKTASRSKAKAADLEAGATEAKPPKVKPAAKAVSTPKAASKMPDAEPKAPSKVAAPGKAKPATVAATVEAAAVAAAPRKPSKTTNEDKA